MDLFKLTKIMFEGSPQYKEVTKGEKRKNYFMINRRMVIQHPEQAQLLNHIKINQEQSVDVWQKFLSKKYGKTPHWMFTKGIKASKEALEKKTSIPDKLLVEYAKYHKLDLRSVKDTLKMFPDKMKKDLKAYEKTMKNAR